MDWRKRLILKWQKDPAWWIENVLGDKLWSKQVDICNSLVTHERTACPASFGCGKTFLAARLALWFLYSFKPSRVISTSPTGRQIKDLLWGEIRDAHRKSDMRLGGKPLTLELRLSPVHYAVGFSTDDTNMDMFTGYHSPNQLVIFDQAGGIPKMTWDAAEGLMTSKHVRWLAISNTAISDGEFASICMPNRTSRHGKWNIIPIRADETPNVVAGRDIIPGLIKHDWVEKRKAQWGVDDPLYKIFVRAEFVADSEMVVVPGRFIDEAFAYAGQLGTSIQIGVDVARKGTDSTLMTARSGTRILEMLRLTGNDTVQVADAVERFALFLERKYDIPVDSIHIDVIGVGAGVVDVCYRTKQLPVVEVNNAERDILSGGDKQRFLNVRAQMAWAFRERTTALGVGLAACRYLTSDLTESSDMHDLLREDMEKTRYKITPAGLIQIVDKEELRKELGRSPDYWDSLVMACETPGGGPPMMEFLNAGVGEPVQSKIMTDDEWQRFVGTNVPVEELLEDRSFREF